MSEEERQSRSISKYVQEIDRIHVIEVQETDLDHMDTVIAREQQALGFLTFCMGTAVSVTLTLSTVAFETVTAMALHWSTLAISLLGSAWFALTWLRERGTRTKLSEQMRRRASPDTSG